MELSAAILKNRYFYEKKNDQEVYSKDIFTFMNNFICTTIYFKSQNYSAITANEKAFDAEVGSDGNVTTQYIVSNFNFSERTLFRELAELKRLGYIQRVGSDKIGAWKVAEKSIVENGETTQKTTQENGSDTTQEKITILSDMQRAILLYLNDHPKANRIELTGAIPNASTDGIKYNLARLQQIGLLKRIGSTRMDIGRWCCQFVRLEVF